MYKVEENYNILLLIYTSECLFLLHCGDRRSKTLMDTQNKRLTLLNFFISDIDSDVSFQDSSFTRSVSK